MRKIITGSKGQVIRMALTDAQIFGRMSDAWNEFYSEYDDEAEWYPVDNTHLWVCDIPSRNITVKLEMNERLKSIKLSEAPMEKQEDYRFLRETEWETKHYFGWV